MAADETVSIGLLREIRDAVERLGTRLEDSLGKRIDATNARLDRMDARLDGMDGRLDGIDGRLDNLERRVTLGFLETNTKLADLTGRVVRVEGEVGRLGARIDNLAGTVGKEVREQAERTTKIEEKRESLGLSEGSPEYGKKE